MWRVIFILIVLLGCAKVTFAQDGGQDVMMMFWNLENFFDYQDDGQNASDHDFSPGGSRHWTAGRFYAKCNAIAKSIMWIEGEFGRLPDIIGVAEVENRSVLNRLIYSTVLKKLDYGIVHYDSPDHRGIDVALLYRKDVFRLNRSRPCHIDKDMATRDILLAEFSRLQDEKTHDEYAPDGGRKIAVMVNHHPSKYGGRKSVGGRMKALGRMKFLGDSLLAEGYADIVAMGDFNESADAEIFGCLDGTFRSTCARLLREGRGSIRYQGKWELIDHFWVGEHSPECEMQVVEIPFLMIRDNSRAGMKPLRTYNGPRYTGGVSDHCPIMLFYRWPEEISK